MLTTRIFVEGLKEQLGKGWDSCNDLTINDLKNISFRPCRAGEDPMNDKCFSAAKHAELRASLLRAANKGGIDADKLKQQAINSMAIPH